MTEKKKRQPSATTLKVRAFAKWQRALDKHVKLMADAAKSANKYQERLDKAQEAVRVAGNDYYELTGEKLPE